MTLQTERVDVVPSQETWIRRTMRRVARTATFRFDWRVLINKRPRLLRMALHTGGIASDTASQSLLLEGSMRIVTIAATHQTFVHFVMERLRERGLHVSVAGIAELRLRDLEKASLASGLMNAMATRTTYVCCSMCGALEVRMCRGVAPQAGVIDCLRRRESEPEDRFYIAAAPLRALCPVRGSSRT